jgi:hypothetical protein
MYQMLDLIIPALTYVDEMRDSRIRSSNLRVIKCAYDMLSITSLREYHLIRDKIPSNSDICRRIKLSTLCAMCWLITNLYK